MELKEQFRYATNSLIKRKRQAFLNILGVVIGIAAIVSMMSLTQGYEKTLTDQLSETMNIRVLTVGSRNAMFNMPGGGGGGGFSGPGGYSDSITLQGIDADAFMEFDNVETACAIYSESAFVKTNASTFRISLYGIDFERYSQIYSTFTFLEGNYSLSNQNSSVLGNTLKNITSTITYSVDDFITVQWQNDSSNEEEANNIDFYLRVSGILNEIGSSMPGSGGPNDMAIYISNSTFLEMFADATPSSILVLLDDTDDTVIADVESKIQTYYGSSSVMISSASAMISSVSSSLETTNLLLTGVAALSLIVAGIGIMNIMMVSLMQRTREIGILKSMGSSDHSILNIFLFEALIIGGIGSAAGIGIGFLLAYIFGYWFGTDLISAQARMATRAMGESMDLTITPFLEPWMILVIFLFGIGVAVISGMIPAWKASKMEPIEALREQ